MMICCRSSVCADPCDKLCRSGPEGESVFSPAFGLVDVAGIVAAAMDLIAAAANANVAGIIDALMDLVAALA
jgi:hypothetical protein